MIGKGAGGGTKRIDRLGFFLPIPFIVGKDLGGVVVMKKLR